MRKAICCLYTGPVPSSAKSMLVKFGEVHKWHGDPVGFYKDPRSHKIYFVFFGCFIELSSKSDQIAIHRFPIHGGMCCVRVRVSNVGESLRLEGSLLHDHSSGGVDGYHVELAFQAGLGAVPRISHHGEMSAAELISRFSLALVDGPSGAADH